MQNKENTYNYSLPPDTKTRDIGATNPLLALAENNWDPAWDQSLQGLVIECSFDFNQISSRMNQTYKTSAFAPETCQKRWGEIHKLRKQKKAAPVRSGPGKSEEETDQQKIERLMRLSAPPLQDPRKGMTLKELEDSLPKTRTQKDFLDPTMKEFDKTTDVLITGEKIVPSGFSILKDRIRPTEDEQKKREEEFLKNLDKISMDFAEGDNESPFVFKPVFSSDNDFQLERFTFDTEEAKKRLEEQVDMTQMRGIEKDPILASIVKPEEEQETWKELQMKELEVKKPGKSEEEEGSDEEEAEAEKNNEFMKMLDKPINIGDAVKALEKLEEGVAHQKKVFFKEESDEEAAVEPEKKHDVFAALEGAPQKAYQQFQNLWGEPQTQKVEVAKVGEMAQSKPLHGILKKDIGHQQAEDIKVEDVKGGSLVVSEEKAREEAGKKEAAMRKMKEEEEIRKQRLFENLKAREVQDFEGDDGSEEEFFEDQRKKRAVKQEDKGKGKVEREEKVVKKEEEVEESEEDKKKQEERAREEKAREEERRAKEEQEAKEKAEEEERISDERLKQLIEASFALKKKEEKPVVAQPVEEEKEEPQEEEDEEEKRKREKRQKKLDEHGRRLAQLLKEVNQRNEDYEKQKEEDEKKMKEEEELRVKQQQEEKKKEEIENLKGAWTNSYVTSLFDDKVSYLKPVHALPSALTQHFEGAMPISERERLLGRYQMLCLPILGNTNQYLASLLEYFLKFSSFNVTNAEGSRVDNESTFLFKTIAVGMFSRYEGQPKSSLEKTIEEGGLVDYLYILFDTFEGRGTRILEDVVRGLQLDYVFGESGAKKIQKELNSEDVNLVLKDIIIFHYKNLDIIDEVFNTKAAMAGVCLSQTEDPKDNEYETTVVLFPFHQKEKAVVNAKDRDQWKSNLSSFLKKISKENLHVIGLKSIYMTREDLENFKYKVGTLPLAEPQPLIAVVVGGYKAVEKVKNMVGSSDVTIARKLEPKSINARYGVTKTDIVCCPTNNHIAKRWLSYLFGGRVSHKDFVISENKPESKFKKDPRLYQIITKPVKNVSLIISSKVGNRGLPRLIRELVNKGFAVSNVQMFTRNMMKHHLENVDKVTNEKFAALANKLDLHCFKFFCDTTQNPCNFLVTLKGTDPNFLREHLQGFLFPQDKSEPRHLISMVEEEDDLNVLDKVFLHNKVKYASPELTQGKNMKHYLFLRPIDNLQDIKQACDDLEALMVQDLELIGCEIMHPHRLHMVRTLLENGLVQSMRVSSYTKKRKEFLNFLTKTADYIENSFLFAAVLRLQDPLKTSEDIAKLPNMANSNFYIPETMIFNYGKPESKTPITKDLFEQVLLEYTMEDMLQLTEKLGIGLGDDRTISNSFIYDLPPKIDGIVQSDVVSTVLAIAKSTVALSSLSFVAKFFEQKGFKVQKINLINVPEELIDGIQLNYACYSPQDIEKWPVLKERLATEPFWVFTLSKYNAIFECKTVIYELLKKVHLFAQTSYNKQVSDKDLPYIYGVYFSRSYEDAQRDLETFGKIYKNKRDLLSSNKVNLSSKLEPIDPNSAVTEPAVIVFRNKAGADKQELYEFLDMFHNLKIKILNFRAVEGFKEEDKESLIEIFKAKHNEEALTAFLSTNAANYYIMAIEYKLGSTLNELVGSFRMKGVDDVVEFSKGHLLKTYGCEFLYTSNFQEVEKLMVKFFGVIDSEHFRIL